MTPKERPEGSGTGSPFKVVQLYGSEIMIWRSTIRSVQMYNFRGLLGIRKMDSVLNVRMRELYGATKGMIERINEIVL